jgi:hypothetical protein
VWYQTVAALRPACARTRTFLWWVIVLAAMTVRTDLAGVTSLVRRHGLRPRCYPRLLYFFHSPALDLPKLIRTWTGLVARIFARRLVRVGDRVVLLADGLNAPKEGKKMPAVKSLRQESAGNTKPTFIMGHSCQAVALRIQAVGGCLAVPLAGRLHEGIVFSNRGRRTLLDKLVGLLFALGLEQKFHLIADAYYASRKVAFPLLAQGHHRGSARFAALRPPTNRQCPGPPAGVVAPRALAARSNSASCSWATGGSSRPPAPFTASRASLPLRYRSLDLRWRPLGRLGRLVLVDHPSRGQLILLGTDPALAPLAIIRLYGWRFKIEVSFKQAIHTVGTYAYHFWRMDMIPLRRGDGNQYLPRQSDPYRAQVRRQLAAYERHIQIGLIVQGLLQYLAVFYHRAVWRFFGSWLRTANRAVAPSEMVVAHALRNSLPDFLLSLPSSDRLKKFLASKLAPERCPHMCLIEFDQAA